MMVGIFQLEFRSELIVPHARLGDGATRAVWVGEPRQCSRYGYRANGAREPLIGCAVVSRLWPRGVDELGWYAFISCPIWAWIPFKRRMFHNREKPCATYKIDCVFAQDQDKY